MGKTCWYKTQTWSKHYNMMLAYSEYAVASATPSKWRTSSAAEKLSFERIENFLFSHTTSARRSRGILQTRISFWKNRKRHLLPRKKRRHLLLHGHVVIYSLLEAQKRRHLLLHGHVVIHSLTSSTSFTSSFFTSFISSFTSSPPLPLLGVAFVSLENLSDRCRSWEWWSKIKNLWKQHPVFLLKSSFFQSLKATLS